MPIAYVLGTAAYELYFLHQHDLYEAGLQKTQQLESADRKQPVEDKQVQQDELVVGRASRKRRR